MKKKKLSALHYSLDTFHRSNQDTSLVHKPTVFEGDWVQPGDLLADCSASEGGELALGHNILVAYMPWEGYNFEDAILISERLVYDDVFTSIHIERYGTETQHTKLGSDQITRHLSDATPYERRHLDSSGVAKIGSWVEEGDILVGKITPIYEIAQSPTQKFLYKLLGKKLKNIRETSLRAPKSIRAKVIKVEVFSSAPMDLNPEVKKKDKTVVMARATTFGTARGKGAIQNKSKQTSVSKTHLISIGTKDSKKLYGTYAASDVGNHSKLYSLIAKKNKLNSAPMENKRSTIVQNSLGFVPANMKPQTTVRLSPQVHYLSTKIRNQLYLKRRNLFMGKPSLLPSPSPSPSPHVGGYRDQQLEIHPVNSLRATKLVYPLFERADNYYTGSHRATPILYPHQVVLAHLRKKFASSPPLTQFSATLGSLSAEEKKRVTTVSFPPTLGVKVHKRVKINRIPPIYSFFNTHSIRQYPGLSESSPKKRIPVKIQIYLAEKRKIQVGDKMAGRHGNKGIISQILPRQDMPYLPDGTAVDIVLNPLGVPSRMNVGQIYECLLGLAGKYLGQHFKIFPFDEIYGPEASRSFVYSKLYEAQQKTGLKWLFNPNTPGKLRLFDGRTGDSFEQPITVGRAYMLKLVHMVDDKIHARSTGPYSLVTQQPLRGRSKQGGQRMGEMEVWAIEGYGAAFTLLEMLTIKSDDMTGRMTLWHNLIFNKEISIGTPESFKVLICELQALCLDIGLFKKQ